MSEHELRFGELAQEWRSLQRRARLGQDRQSAATVSDWERSLSVLAADTSRLKADGRWRSGPRTLLEVLGHDRRELSLVATLGWLLRPSGHHGLGGGLVASLMEWLGAPYQPEQPVRVALEESRRDAQGVTRADLVLRVGPTCVLLEAKVHAGEHLAQCDRLARLWAAESPHLVFLSLHGDGPVDAPLTSAQWRALRWSQVAKMIRGCMSTRTPSAGALDFVECLEGLPGGTSH